MKRIQLNTNAYLTFVRDVDYVTDGLFTLSLYKTVGDDSLVLSDISDFYGLPSCKPYIALNVDLSVNNLPLGEYLYELEYDGVLYERGLVEVYEDLPNPNGGSDTYKDVIIL